MSSTVQPELSSITVGPVTTRLLQAGPNQASEAVVFIHGNPGSAGDWAGLVGQVAEHRRAVAFDLPDFGQTVAGPEFGHTVAEYAEFVGDTLEALGISSVHLVLHDFGGPIGLHWAKDNLGRVKSLSLIDTGLLLDYKWHRTARAWQTKGVGEALQAITTRPMFRRVTGNAEPRGLPREFLDEMYDNYDRRTRAAILDLYRDAKKISAGPREAGAAVRRGRHPVDGHLGRAATRTSVPSRPSARRKASRRSRSTSCPTAVTGPSSTTHPPSSACWSSSSTARAEPAGWPTPVQGSFAL